MAGYDAFIFLLDLRVQEESSQRSNRAWILDLQLNAP